MEKIYIKPVSKEVITKGPQATGHSDIFSYHPDSTEESKKLGSLFIVGHVQHQSDDVAYMINLVAALAKREYFAKAALAPREAFANTLRKINEVVEEFFKNRDLAIDIGVFVIAGEQIYISRLGKFKIILARDEKNIDILNNIEFFEKEHIQEKEFSNIISGKMLAGDRILAFYPGQPVVSREKYIKAHFLNLSENEFIRKINDIKTANEQFSCALLYIHLNRVKETAKAPQIQPSELLEVSLASQPESPAPRARKPGVSKSAPSAPEPEASLAAVEVLPTPEYPEKNELPRIIPSEFSLGKRSNPVASALRGFRFIKFSFNLKNKVFLSVVAVGIIVGAAFAAKALFIVDPQARKLKSALESLKSGVDTAQAKLQQNDKAGARATVLHAVATLGEIPDGSRKSALSAQLFGILDGIDQAQEASPSLLGQLPAELGTVKLLAASENGFYAYSTDSSGAGSLSVLEDNSVKSRWDTGSVQPTALVNNNGSPALVDLAGHVIATPKGDKLRTTTWSEPAGAFPADLYQDNLYVLGSGSIYKIADAARTNGKPAAWLKKDSAPGDGAAIVVDGNIFVLSRSGVLSVYYKGAKTGEYNTPVVPADGSLFLTPQDSAYLFLIDKKMNRIYLLNKKDGTLAKTYKIDTPDPMVAAAVGNDDSIYFVSKDQRMWKIK